ncbi:MAG: STAS domain-containing protein [Bryobacteraceae bacterium]|nr:STAS domain-containing protein [Bryobacteraceae bacterium]
MATNFQIERSERGDAVVLALDGFLDAHTAPQFENAISDEVTAGHLRLIADCRNLSYISSAGLGVFMSFIEEIREKGGDIKLAGITPKVYQVFEVLGFHELFDIVDSIEAASALFAKAAERKD